ncbi:MAG: malectin domain-containing carbohydrate-binding protein [Rhodothermales bacterium]
MKRVTDCEGISMPRVNLSLLFLLVFCWLSTSAQAQVVVYRVNAGGRATQAADVTYPDWAEDQQFSETPPPLNFARNGTPSVFVNEDVAGDQTAGRNQDHNLSDITNPAAGEDVFVTQRWDPLDPEANMVWSFPVDEEVNYNVVLYFSEMYGEGLLTREFDIFIDGVQVEDNFNILQETGNVEKVGVQREYTVAATDGTLDIEFVNQDAANGSLPAVINAIEIVYMDSNNPAPTITAIPDQSNLEGEQVSLQVVASDSDDNDTDPTLGAVVVSYAAENLPIGLQIDAASGLITGTIASDAEDVYESRIIVLDSGFPVAGAIENFTWTIGNSNPVVETPIEDISRLFGDPEEIIDLANVFADPLGGELIFSLEGNNNPSVVTEDLDGSELSLVFSTTTEGTAEITVRATNQFEEFVEDQFTVNLLAAYPEALVQVTPSSGGLGASTFTDGSIVIENTSPGSSQIVSVAIDLSTALYPDMVFDPAGTAGDTAAKCLEPNSGADVTGYVVPANNCVDPFSNPNEGGFFEIAASFSDFDPGETFTFSVDTDPTSIKGNPGTGDAGDVGGIELIGSTITVEFSDGSTVTNELFHISGEQGGSETIVRTNVPVAPGITLVDGDGATTSVSEAVQNITVAGFPGQNFRLFQSDGRLNLSGVPGGGFDLEPFEANEAIGNIWEYTGVIGEGGTTTVEVLLRKSDKTDDAGDGGLNHFIAAIDGEFVGRVSNKLVVELATPTTISLSEGWNLLGLSYDVPDPAYTAVFGDAAPDLAPFIWINSAYTQTTDLVVGSGYWLDIETSSDVVIEGTEVSVVQVDVVDGWNMISGPSCVFDMDNAQDPSGVIIDGNLFRYAGVYVAAGSLTPNVGYWQEASGSGTLTFDCNPAIDVAQKERVTKPEIAPHATFAMLRVSDEASRKQDLYFGSELADKLTKRQYNMPPLMLDAFDVRFSDHSRLDEGTDGIIRVQGATFPVTLEVIAPPQRELGMLTLEAYAGNEVVDTYQVFAGDKVVISNDAVTAFRLGADTMELEALPESFELTGNYPNPFNPSTTIVFDLPEDATMQVGIYDLLGRQVMSLDAIEMAAGASRQVQLDASSLASGTYLYKVEARMASGAVISTGRMTLLK